MTNSLIPIILSGGNGTRLFPMSKQDKPKQFINLLNDKTCFTQTINRVVDKEYFNNPMILGNINHIDLIKKEIINNNLDNIEILLEPKARNTAPAICSCIEYLYKNNRKNEIIVFLPSDAYIKENDLFKEYIIEGIKEANKNKVVVFGIKPIYPETGYGYIKLGDKIDNNTYYVDKFTEKPNIEIAKEFLKSNQYLWNAGIFMSKVETLYNLFQQYQLELLNNIEDTLNNSKIEEKTIDNHKIKEIYLNKDIFIKSEDISIDYAIIENLNKNNLSVISMNIIWSDLGSYKSLYDNDINRDENNNIIKGNKENIILHNTKNSFIKLTDNKKIICCSDINNLVIVEDNNVILIMNKDKSQNVKKVIEKIKKKEELKGYL